MRVLFISEQYYPPFGGVAMFLRRLTKDVAARGDEVFLMTAAPGSGAKLKKKKEDDVVVYQMPTFPLLQVKGFVWSRPCYKECEEVIEKIKPDIIHVHSPISPLTMSALKVIREKKIPMVFTNHVMAENILMNLSILRPFKAIVDRYFWKLIMKVANSADFVTSPTKTALSFLQDHGLKSQSDFVTNGVRSDFFVPGFPDAMIDGFNLPDDRTFLLHVGRLDGEKRIDILINAMPLILKYHADAMLLLAGSGTMKQDFEKMVKGLGIEGSVRFLGFVSETQKRALLQCSDLFVIASPAELQCIAALEALSCGLPVVAADQAALRDLIDDNKNGRSFKFPSSGSLANEVIELLDDDALRRKLGRSVRKFIEVNHDAYVSTNKYLEIYGSLVVKFEEKPVKKKSVKAAKKSVATKKRAKKPAKKKLSSSKKK